MTQFLQAESLIIRFKKAHREATKLYGSCPTVLHINDKDCEELHNMMEYLSRDVAKEENLPLPEGADGKFYGCTVYRMDNDMPSSLAYENDLGSMVIA